MFWRNKNLGEKNINSNEYDSVLKKISEINAELELFKTKLNLIKTDLDNLRGRFNQRIAKGREGDDKEAGEPTKELNNGEFIPLG